MGSCQPDRLQPLACGCEQKGSSVALEDKLSTVGAVWGEVAGAGEGEWGVPEARQVPGDW